MCSVNRATVTAVPGTEAVRTVSRRRGVGSYRNAIYWFALLLIILLVGFWRSYFSELGRGSLHVTHHVHGVAMLLWVLLLMVQSWFIRGMMFRSHAAGWHHVHAARRAPRRIPSAPASAP